VAAMLDAVMNGNGSMAQFSHPEFGGSGQWMRGGMIMIGDMFNNTLKGRIDALCNDLSTLIAGQPDLIQAGSLQSQTQGAYPGSQQQQSSAGPVGSVSLFVPEPAVGLHGNWWPQELGSPSSTGAQNNVRYAYFSLSRRLAVELNGTVNVYDTLDHQIGGFSQQQGIGRSLTFSSQHGIVDVSSLPVILIDGAVPQQSTVPKQEAAPASTPGTESGDIFTAIERLADLRSRGILNDAEFNARKAELLSRL
jgi:Short C-terminal domain